MKRCQHEKKALRIRWMNEQTKEENEDVLQVKAPEKRRRRKALWRNRTERVEMNEYLMNTYLLVEHHE